MLHARLAALLLAPLLAGAGCGAEAYDPFNSDTPLNPNPTGSGRFFIAWTVDGQVPTAPLCEGVAELRLEVAYPDARYTIKPITCILDRFRYDGMPTGSATLTLTGYDAAGCAVTTGTAAIVVTTTKPASPSPVIALAKPHACP